MIFPSFRILKCTFIVLFWSVSVHAFDCYTPAADLESLKDLNVVKNEIEEPPFMVACKTPPGLLKGRPETGLFKRSVPENDSKGNMTKELLGKVIAKVRERINDAKFQMQNIQTCMDKTTPECAELKSWVDKDLPLYVKQARFHLSLSQSQHEIKSWVGVTSEKPNSDLSSLGGYKLVDWAPLTKEEDKRAKDTLAIYKKEIQGESKKNQNTKNLCRDCGIKFSDALLAVRFQHYQAYHQMLSELPLMQYLKGPGVSQGDLKSAFKQMQSDLNSESTKLDEYEKMLSQSPIPTDALKLLNYSSQLEEVLLDDNKSCGLASSLVFTASNREIGTGLAIGLPILAASIFAAPVVLAAGGTALAAGGASIAVGAASGGAFAMQSYADFKATEKRTMGYIYGDALGADLANLEAANRSFKYDLITLPVGFGLGNVALRSLTISAKSLAVARKVWAATN